MSIERWNPDLSPERQRQRDELVAVIAAGRELSPEHDYLLADLYLEFARHNATTAPKTSWLFDNAHRLRNVIAAACLAIAALIFSFLIFEGGEASSTPDRAMFVSRHGPPPWWESGNSGNWWQGDSPWRHGDGDMNGSDH